MHRRTEKPPVFTDYRRYKPYLRIEFGGRCVYCRKCDDGQDSGSFHVEHYRPKGSGLFPERINEYVNLFYACASCNRFKRNYWSDEKSKQVLNPCDHVMTQHLGFVKEVVQGRSSQGELNVELLRLNNEESTLYRKKMIELTLLLIEGIISSQDSRKNTGQDWIDRAVTMLSTLTYHSEEKIRKALKVKKRNPDT